MKRWWILKGIKMFFLFVLIGAAMTYLVMTLWNWLMPVVFGLSVITFWQALGILLLSKLIFGFGRGGWGHKGHYTQHWNNHRSSVWKEKMEEKLKTMSPEDREKFREEWKKRCGWKYQHFEDEKKSESQAE
ncbi:MAG: hypothetical protein IPO83_01500 [Chitinophagaceae bacterium]|nr:hypothetical protein [Chitinophagaceae bacterium]